MKCIANPPVAPAGQQGPPARAAGALRSTRGSLLLTTGTAYAVLDAIIKP
jgi:hypothetical protein